MAEEKHHYVYGSGMIGCLYDNGPNFCETVDQAIESLLFVFDELDEEEVVELKENLKNVGLHYFKNPSETGAHYCDCTKHLGPCPEDDDD